MIDQFAKQLFNDLQQKLQSEDLPSSSQLKAIIESGLKRLNLVTREEFDAQSAVLMRTREKLDALERQLAELENKPQ